ncbi:hypothetical protein HG535_0G01740 [Zygotorulaspora mrakii]|uniref:Protein YIP n=1 Tax=Zygotorulaspora mrakii TaxID=42260 RepID=A0A7H9B6X7_ZYGMR|nr:uncharacterized protein HG535_0G01740 [Zygotorulaspora mrakii]QLG74290.1 hypothetical protein HG535_0G01740 [Zygotorulaspora mrakii]
MSDDMIEPDVVESRVGGGFGGSSSAGVDAGYTSNRGTLDESVYETFKRDVLDINTRLKQVVYPHFGCPQRCTAADTGRADVGDQRADVGDQREIHCDLWAPLTFILVYAASLSRSNTNALFSTVFVSLWFVLLVMAVHLRLTKIRDGNSLLSYISISGYCLFPLVVNNLVSQVILPLLFHNLESHLLYRIYTALRLVILGGSLLWSISAVSFVTKSTTFIQVYPLALCLFGVGWLSILS